MVLSMEVEGQREEDVTISMIVTGLYAYSPCHMREQGPKEDTACGPSAELRQFDQAHPPYKGVPLLSAILPSF